MPLSLPQHCTEDASNCLNIWSKHLVLLFPLLMESSQCCWSCCLSQEGKHCLVVWLQLWSFWGACYALLWRVESLKRQVLERDDFFFFNLENSSLNQKAAPIPPCCRNCCVKIKSGPIVMELDRRRLSIRSELKAGKEHQPARQIFQAFSPSPPPSLFRFILTSV